MQNIQLFPLISVFTDCTPPLAFRPEDEQESHLFIGSHTTSKFLNMEKNLPIQPIFFSKKIKIIFAEGDAVVL